MWNTDDLLFFTFKIWIKDLPLSSIEIKATFFLVVKKKPVL